MLLTLIEHDRGLLVDTALEALTLARGLAAAHGEPVEAVVLGTAGHDLTATLRDHGVARLHVAEHELLDDYAPEAWAAALAALLDTLEPTGLVASGTERGNEVLARLAAIRDLPLATSCIDISGDGTWELTRLRWGGILYEESRLSAAVNLATVAPHAVSSSPVATPVDTVVDEHAPELAPGLARTRVVDRVSKGGGVTLTTAPVVVSGGRGVGSAEGFAVLEELAELVGGAVGCSRVATSNGWRPHSDQVGQTGSRVAPDLYVACGISGATQHWVGCMNAKRILAINTDPEAPMVTRAHYAVIGDVHEVLPAVVAEVRQRKGATVGAGT